MKTIKIKNTGKEILAKSENVPEAKLELVRSDSQYDYFRSLGSPSSRLIAIPVEYLAWMVDPSCWTDVPIDQIGIYDA